MANFKTHLGVAGALSVGVAGAGWYLSLYGLPTAVLCAIVGTLGGLLPDIDLDSSKPAQHGFMVGSLLVSTLVVILYANRYTDNQLILDSLILWAASYVLIRYGLIETFSRFTVHRGIVHSVPMMAVLALAVVSGVFYGLKLTAFVSWMFGIILFFGALIHLLLDEIYSVDAFGMRLKRSAGTAFKFFELKKPIPYACLYALVAALFYTAPPYADVLRAFMRIAKTLSLPI